MSELDAAHAATGLVYRQLLQQASMLSYVDVFHTLMILVICVVPLVFLMEKPKKRGPAGEAAA